MKKSLLCRFATFGTALLLSSLAVFPAFAANIRGHLDTVSAHQITGWAWDADAPDTAVSIELSIVNTQDTSAVTIFTVPAQNPREDLALALGSANHGYVHNIDWSKIPGETFTVTAAAVSGETKIPLIGSISYTKEPETGIALSAEAHGSEVIVPVVEKPVEKPAASKSSGSKASSSKKDSSDSSASVPSTSDVEPGEYIGEFTASGYCNCQKCSGGYSKTYSGTIPKANHTIAADLDYYPIGTKLMIDGIVYTVEDRGSGVNDNRLDIYFATHAEALAFGLQKVDVYAAE